MENSSQLLDQEILMDPESAPKSLPIANTGRRFLNFLIDTLITRGLNFLLLDLTFSSGVGDNLMSISYLLISLLIPVFYYAFFEIATGRTIAKYLTGTRVVNEQGGEITFGQALGRSLCRFIPLEPFSFLGSVAIGWHDRIPKTRVIVA